MARGSQAGAAATHQLSARLACIHLVPERGLAFRPARRRQPDAGACARRGRAGDCRWHTGTGATGAPLNAGPALLSPTKEALGQWPLPHLNRLLAQQQLLAPPGLEQRGEGTVRSVTGRSGHTSA